MKKYEMNTYIYKGPVMIFNSCVDRNWESETWAPSEKKALSNLMFQYKKRHNLDRGAKVGLPGKLTVKENTYGPISV